jgi:hypothetical protein
VELFQNGPERKGESGLEGVDWRVNMIGVHFRCSMAGVQEK